MNFMNRWLLAKELGKRGQINGTIGVIIGITIAIIIIVAVALPVTEDIINTATCANESNLSICSPTTTGTTATVLELVPLFLGLAALVVVASLFA